MKAVLNVSLIAAVLAILYIYWRPGVEFTLEEASIKSLQAALFSGQITCLDVVEQYTARINEYDYKLSSVLRINTHAFERARELDALPTRQKKQLPLFCVPILLKDNIDTYDMPTTAGSKSMVNCTSTKDAFVVDKLRSAGAVILGKNNLNEFAFQGISRSSLGGQVKNPYDLSRTPGGSSGGTGASIAANFAMVGIGTDTMNSVRSPASACNLVGFRATRGLISRDGVCPVSWTQDQVGPMARSVEDVNAVFDVISGFYDENDNSTAFANVFDRPYSQIRTLKGLRLGVLRSYINHTIDETTTEVSSLFERTLTRLSDTGADLIDIGDEAAAALHPTRLARAQVELYEFELSINEYLTDPRHHNCPKSLREIISSGLVDQFALGPGWELVSREKLSVISPEYEDRTHRIENLKQSYAKIFASHSLDALIYPHQTIFVVPIGTPTQSGRNGLLTSLTGAPGIVIPMGFGPFDKFKDNRNVNLAPLGVPLGLEIVGTWGTDRKILEIAGITEKTLSARRKPILIA